MLRTIARRLRYILRGRQSENDLDREIRFHIDMETQERAEGGLTASEARRSSLADFGSLLSCKEDVREAWGLRLWYDFRRDMQYAFRTMRRRPGFATLTILTLAIGIGANTAVFSVFDRALLRALPYREPDRLVHVWETRTDQEFVQREASYPNFEDWKRRNNVFDDLAGYNGTNFTLTGLGTPVRISATRVTANMFTVLGVRPQLGRDFMPDEEAAAKSVVAVITHGFWQRQFGGEADVLGQTLRLGGVAHTIVGVLPRDFQFALDGTSEIFVPLGAPPNQLQRRQFHWLKTVGRMKPNVGIAKAETEMKRIAEQLAVEHKDTNAGASVRLVPLQEQIVGNLRPVLVVIFGAAGCMLCLAFANLANLMIAQSTGRQREIGIRVALGAASTRLGRQLIAECVVVALIAGIVSLFVAHWTLQAMMFSVPQPLLTNFRALADSSIDTRVVLFTFALALAAGAFTGAIVAHRVSKNSVVEAIRGGAWTGPSNRGLRSTFTVVEIALSVMLLVGAVVMIQSVQRLLSVDPGFNAAGIISMHLSLPAAQYKRPEDVSQFYNELRRRVRTLAEVENTAVIDELPLTTEGGTMYLFVYGQPEPQPGSEQESVVRSASPGYFETMGIRVVRGRAFAETDLPSAESVMVLNETLARRLFGDTDPVGRQVVLPFDKSVWRVIGVVGDVHLADLDRRVRPTFYSCSLQDPSRSSTLVVRTTASADAIAGVVRAEVHRLDSELPVYAVRSVEETINLTPGVASRKLVLHLVVAFSSIGTLMAGIGLYGLMNFLVAQRAKEIGIRIALGADRHRVRRLVLNQAMLMTGVGLAVGIVMAVAATRLMQSVLFGVTPSDPLILMTVTMIVGSIAYAACFIPVSRATRIDPIVVLRND